MATTICCLQSLPQPVQNIVAGKKPSNWVSVIKKQNKPGQLLKLYESSTAFKLEKIAAEAFRELSKTKLTPEHTERFRNAQILFNEQRNSKKGPLNPKKRLFTAKLATTEDYRSTQAIIDKWAAFACTKYKVAHRLSKHDPSFSKTQLAGDSAFAVQSLQKECPNASLNANKSIYVTYDKKHRLQAAAIVTYSEENGYYLDYLASNPKNVALFPDDAPVTRGAATAVIKHIFTDILTSPKTKKTFSLWSTTSGKAFYEKLGMIPRGPDAIYYFDLTHPQIQEFLKKVEVKSTIEKKAPPFKI